MRQLELWSGGGAGAGVSAAATPVRAAAAGAAVAPGADGAIQTWLADRLGRPVELVFTDNRSTVISYRERDGRVQLRVQGMFRHAGEREWQAIAEFVRGRRRRAGRVLDEFLTARIDREPRAPAGELRAAGRFHHLGHILGELNATYFHDAVQAAITWGGTRARRYRRTIQLGLYLRAERLIRIHPCLDQAFVPRHYVSWIVFHEMLHDVFGAQRHGGRRSVHPPELRAIEQSYPDYERCVGWERRNIHRLLGYRSQR